MAKGFSPRHEPMKSLMAEMESIFEHLSLAEKLKIDARLAQIEGLDVRKLIALIQDLATRRPSERFPQMCGLYYEGSGPYTIAFGVREINGVKTKSDPEAGTGETILRVTARTKNPITEAETQNHPFILAHASRFKGPDFWEVLVPYADFDNVGPVPTIRLTRLLDSTPIAQSIGELREGQLCFPIDPETQGRFTVPVVEIAGRNYPKDKRDVYDLLVMGGRKGSVKLDLNPDERQRLNSIRLSRVGGEQLNPDDEKKIAAMNALAAVRFLGTPDAIMAEYLEAMYFNPEALRLPKFPEEVMKVLLNHAAKVQLGLIGRLINNLHLDPTEFLKIGSDYIHYGVIPDTVIEAAAAIDPKFFNEIRNNSVLGSYLGLRKTEADQLVAQCEPTAGPPPTIHNRDRAASASPASELGSGIKKVERQ